MNIVVVGARSLLRAGLTSLLSGLGFESIEEALDVKHLIASVRTQPFGKLIIYLFRDSENVISAAKEIRGWDPTVKIVFVGQDLDLEIMSACFAAGASGYLLRTISGDALRESVLLVQSGEKVFPSELASKFPVLTSKPVNRDPNNSEGSQSGLSRREHEILRCLANGQSNKVIARNLEIAEATVKVHIKRILRKARVKNRTQAALWAISKGIPAKPDDPKARS